MAYIMLGEEQKAVSVIKKAIAENAQWKENLPAFYCLHNHPEISAMVDEDSFTLKDWCNAIDFLIEVNRNQEAIDLAGKIVKKYPSSSFIYYLLAKAYSQTGNKKSAKANATLAIQLDAGNAEAKILFEELNK